MVNSDKKWIMLNVGGTYFMTSRATLSRASPPNSPLHRISSNSTNVQWDRDEKGAYLIDRDPEFFQSVLNFLRHGRLVLSRDLAEEGIIMEAEYFQLPELVKAARQRLALRQRYLQAAYLNHQLQQHLCAPSSFGQPLGSSLYQNTESQDSLLQLPSLEPIGTERKSIYDYVNRMPMMNLPAYNQ